VGAFGVVRDADPGQQRDLLAAQARDPAGPAFYAGWPSGMAALTQLKTIIADIGSGASR